MCSIKKVERIWNSFREKQTKKEIIPYPTCSVVAVFKMLIRILTRSKAASGIWYYFFFLFFGSRRNEFNSLWGGRWGRGRKVVAYSDIAFGRAHIVRWTMVLRRPRQSVDKFIIILSQYIIFLFWTRYLPSKQKTSDILPLIFPHTIEFIHLKPKHRK